MEKIIPPKGLTAETARWYCEVAVAYSLKSHHLRLLTLACHAWDRAQAARVALRKEGVSYSDRHGVKRPNPQILIERNSALSFARLMRELGLENESAEEKRLRRLPEWARRAHFREREERLRSGGRQDPDEKLVDELLQERMD